MTPSLIVAIILLVAIIAFVSNRIPAGIVALGDSPAVAEAFHQQRVLLVAGRADPLFPLPGVDEVVAALAPGIADHELFAGGHELPDQMLTHEVEWLIRELNSLGNPDGAGHGSTCACRKPHTSRNHCGTNSSNACSSSPPDPYASMVTWTRLGRSSASR